MGPPQALKSAGVLNADFSMIHRLIVRQMFQVRCVAVQSQVERRSTVLALAGHQHVRETSAIVLQRWVRGFLARKRFRALVAAQHDAAALSATPPPRVTTPPERSARPASRVTNKRATLTEHVEALGPRHSTTDRSLRSALNSLYGSTKMSLEEERAARAALFAINSHVVPSQLTVATRRRELMYEELSRQQELRGPRVAQSAAVAAEMLRAARSGTSMRSRLSKLPSTAESLWTYSSAATPDLMLSLPQGRNENVAVVEGTRNQQAWSASRVRFAHPEPVLPRVRAAAHTPSHSPPPHCQDVVQEESSLTLVRGHGSPARPQRQEQADDYAAGSEPVYAEVANKPGSAHRRPRAAHAQEQHREAKLQPADTAGAPANAFQAGPYAEVPHAAQHSSMQAPLSMGLAGAAEDVVAAKDSGHVASRGALLLSRHAQCRPSLSKVDAAEQRYDDAVRAAQAAVSKMPQQSADAAEPPMASKLADAQHTDSAAGIAHVMRMTQRGTDLAALGPCFRKLVGLSEMSWRKAACSQKCPEQAVVQLDTRGCIVPDVQHVSKAINELDTERCPIGAYWTRSHDVPTSHAGRILHQADQVLDCIDSDEQHNLASTASPDEQRSLEDAGLQTLERAEGLARQSGQVLDQVEDDNQTARLQQAALSPHETSAGVLQP